MALNGDGATFLTVACHNTTVSVRLLDAAFPDYRGVIPKKTGRTLVVMKSLLIAALRRVQVVASSKTHGVRMHIGDERIRITADNPDLGSSEETIGGVRVNGDKAQGKSIVINWRFTDTQQDYALTLSNSALSHATGTQAPNADATLTLARATLDDISLQKTSFPKALAMGDIKISGNPLKVMELLGLLEDFTPGFPVVEPRPAR